MVVGASGWKGTIDIEIQKELNKGPWKSVFCLIQFAECTRRFLPITD